MAGASLGRAERMLTVTVASCCENRNVNVGAPWQRGRSMDLAQYIRDIADFPKPGILFKDITPLLADPPAFAEAIRLLSEHYRLVTVDAIAAAEARGFLFAAPMALQLRKPLVPL